MGYGVLCLRISVGYYERTFARVYGLFSLYPLKSGCHRSLVLHSCRQAGLDPGAYWVAYLWCYIQFFSVSPSGYYERTFARIYGFFPLLKSGCHRSLVLHSCRQAGLDPGAYWVACLWCHIQFFSVSPLGYYERTFARIYGLFSLSSRYHRTLVLSIC